MKRLALPLCLVVLVSAAWCQDRPLDRLERMDFRKVRLEKKDLVDLDASDLEFLRGIVFGKRGRVFKDPEIQGYLEEQSWYRRNPRFTNAGLTANERYNLDLIRQAEAEEHDGVRPGDLRFWRHKRIAKTQLADASLTDLRIMRGEIEAIHGRRFPNEPLLQAYFDERYWYKPSPKYDPRRLNEFERANIATLRAVEKKGLRGQVGPWEMEAFEAKPLQEAQLRGMSLYELRLARNWFYALRGHRFRTPWLREFFDGFEWYKPLPPGRTLRLSKMDKRNVATILRVEKRRHDDLSKKPLTRELLRGLFVEDLRKLANEIPARHGKPFADRLLRSYFSSMPWYKPNPRYRESALSPIERQNIAFLRAALAEGTRQFDLAEG